MNDANLIFHSKFETSDEYAVVALIYLLWLTE